MKYIKSFESKGDKIKEDDYVIALNFSGYDHAKKYLINSVGKVIMKKNFVLYTKYIVEYDNIPNLLFNHYAFYNDDIRLATPKEIEQYKLEKISNKYNL